MVKISEASLRIYIDELGKTPLVAFLTSYNYSLYIILRHNWLFYIDLDAPDGLFIAFEQ